MPLLSVIIPNYNHAPFLNQRIDSVLNQTFQDFEVIILDDCSTDDSRKVIEDYRNHPKISHIILNEINSGSPFKQWEKGISLATGEWIWIAESDDWCETNFLEEIFKEMISYDVNEISIAYTHTYIYNTDRNLLNVVKPSPDKSKYHKKNIVLEKIMLPRLSIINASMAIFKREKYSQITKDFQNYNYCGDWLFWIEIGKTGDVLEVNKFLNYFRIHNKNTYKSNKITGLVLLEELKILSFLLNEKLASRKLILASVEIFFYEFIAKKMNIKSLSRVKEIDSTFIKILGSRKVIYLKVKVWISSLIKKN